ncbi:hypothetical protein DFH06DRAFT_1430369 [Mycena polygramma]|nr:hypothetical protein DFH06DRAFT_1430369 [Mycena polygramma]
MYQSSRTRRFTLFKKQLGERVPTHLSTVQSKAIEPTGRQARLSALDVATPASKVLLYVCEAPPLGFLKPVAGFAHQVCEMFQAVRSYKEATERLEKQAVQVEHIINNVGDPMSPQCMEILQILEEIRCFLDTADSVTAQYPRRKRLRLWLVAAREQDRARTLSERLRDTVSVLIAATALDLRQSSTQDKLRKDEPTHDTIITMSERPEFATRSPEYCAFKLQLAGRCTSREHPSPQRAQLHRGCLAPETWPGSKAFRPGAHVQYSLEARQIKRALQVGKSITERSSSKTFAMHAQRGCMQYISKLCTSNQRDHTARLLFLFYHISRWNRVVLHPTRATRLSRASDVLEWGFYVQVVPIRFSNRGSLSRQMPIVGSFTATLTPVVVLLSVIHDDWGRPASGGSQTAGESGGLLTYVTMQVRGS